MNNLINDIFSNGLNTQIIDDNRKFLKFFPNLYRIELFKEGLDLILTKVKQGHLQFDIKVIKDWDTNVGCFLTQKRTFLDKAINTFYQRDLKIIIRKLSYNVLAHEMAHAIEYESGINLGNEFKQAIMEDMKSHDFPVITLSGEIRRLMVDALIDYPPNQHTSELFARYYELLSISRDVLSNGDFSANEVMRYFKNTTNFIKNSFNPLIKDLADQSIAQETINIASEVKIIENKTSFTDKVNSFHSKSFEKSFSKNINSNSSWIKGWQKHQQLEDDKK